MIPFYDKDGNYNPITIYDDLCITKHLDGFEDTLSFTVDTHLEQYSLIEEECRLVYDGNYWLVKKISDETIECYIDFDFLKEEVFVNYYSDSVAVDTLLETLLPSDWTVEGETIPTGKHTLSLDFATLYDILQQAMATYDVYFTWQTENKIVTIHSADEDISTGVYITDELNLRSISYYGETTNFATRIYPYGSEGMTIADVNDGLEYVENYTYSDKIVCAYWSDERYTVAENLLTAAQEKLDEMAYPVRSYECDVVDLAKTSESKYSFLDFQVHKTVTLIDRLHGVRVDHKIVEYKMYPDAMEDNTVTLSTVVQDVNDALASTAESVQETVEANIEDAIEDAVVSYASAYIEDLTARVATIEEAYVDTAYVGTLLADYATIAELTAYKAEITELTAKYITAEEIDATYIRADELEAEVATFGYITADSAVITDLTAEVANINSLLAGNIGAGTVQTVHLTSENVVIDDAVINDAAIVSLTASKITSGTIYTNLVTIQSDSGNLYITDNTIQIQDDNDVVRVQIGEDASGDYNLYLWDASGNLLWDAEGLYAAGIHDGIIKDIAVADDAAISGTKLDIASVASELNKDGSLTVNVAQVTIDDTTLEYRLTTITTATDEAVAAAQAAQDMAEALESEAVSSLTQYYAIGSSAEDPPSTPSLDDTTWVEDFPTVEDGEYLWTAFYVVYADESAEWTTPTCLTDGVARSAVSTLQTELEVVQGQITAKVWQTDIDEAVSSISIGGRNYVLNSGGYSEGDDVSWALSGGTSYYTLSVEDGYTRVYCDTTVSSSYSVLLDLSDDFDSSESYMFSCKVRLSTAASLAVRASYTTSSSTSTFTTTLNTFSASEFTDGEWVALSFTFTPNSSYDYTCIGFYLSNVKTAGYYLDIAYVKLEQGNVVTDWTPAPEDTTATLTALTDKYASITVTLDGITDEVAELTTTVTDNYSTLTSKVGTLETTSESITATVQEMIVSATTNIIVDGTFDGYTTFGSSYSWYRYSSTYTTVSTYDDLPCICFTRGGTNYYIRQAVSLAAGTYLVKVKLACGSDYAPVCRVRIGSTDTYTYLCEDGELTTEWATYTATITTTATSSYFYLYCYSAEDVTTATTTEMYATDIEVYATDDLYAAIAQIEVLSTSIELCVTVEESTGYLRLGTGDDDTVKFTVDTDNFTVDEDGNLSITGTVTAENGVIGGWNIASTKIYGTAADGTTTAVMQISGLTEDTAYVFACGGTSHSSYADCPFRVNKIGGMWVDEVVVANSLAAGGNVSATALVGGNDYGLYCQNASGTAIRMAYLSTNNNVVLGHSDYATYIYGSTIYANGLRVKEVQHGNVSISVSAADTPTSVSVTFSTAFSGTPDVVLSAATSSPATSFVGVLSPSSTGCTIYLTRTTTGTITVRWVAVY